MGAAENPNQQQDLDFTVDSEDYRNLFADDAIQACLYSGVFPVFFF